MSIAAEHPAPPEVIDRTDPVETVPTSAVSQVPRNTARWVAIAAAVLLVAQGVVRGWVGYRGYFFLDDFAFTGRAAQHSVTDVHGYLMQSYNSHLMPGAFVQVSIMTALWPLNFGAVVTVNLVLQALVGFAFYRLLRELFGTRPAILVPFAVFLFTPITLPAFLWWAAALNQLPQQLAMIVALLCQTRYLRTGRTRTGALGAVAILGGLLFSEKTLLTVPLVAAYTLLWFADGHPVHRVVTCWRAHWRVWVAYLVVIVPYVGYYAFEVPSPGRTPTDGADVWQLLGSSFGHALNPGLLGGPWHWFQIGFVGGIAAPGQGATYLSTLVVLAVVTGSIAWYRRAVYGWSLAFGYAMITLALLAFSRATFIGVFIGDEYRYVTDVAAVAVLGASLALLRPAGEWKTPPSRLERRAWPERYASLQVVRDVREVLPHLNRTALLATAMIAVIASSTISTLRYDRVWGNNPAKPYITNLSADMAAAPAGTVVYDQEAPNQVAWALLFPYNRLSHLVAPLDLRPRFLHMGQSARHLVITDDQGHLRRLKIVGRSAIQGPASVKCNWGLGVHPVHIPLDSATFPWVWIMHVGYTATSDTRATIHAGKTNVQVPLHAGANDIFLQVAGRVDAVDISGLSNGATACATDIEVGQPEPIPGTRP